MTDVEVLVAIHEVLVAAFGLLFVLLGLFSGFAAVQK